MAASVTEPGYASVVPDSPETSAKCLVIKGAGEQSAINDVLVSTAQMVKTAATMRTVYASVQLVGVDITVIYHVCLGFMVRNVLLNAPALGRDHVITSLESASVLLGGQDTAANQFARRVATGLTAQTHAHAMAKTKSVHQKVVHVHVPLVGWVVIVIFVVAPVVGDLDVV